MNKNVTAIIPAYNEENTITGVIDACIDCSYVDEVIVIDDGSVDNTENISKAHGAKVIRLNKNSGKAMALCIGAKKSKNEILLLLDADLIGLDKNHVFSLILPVFQSSNCSTIGIFKNGRIVTDLAHRVTPQLSGQRCIPKSVLLSLRDKCGVGYGIEISINRKLKKLGFNIEKVKLEHVTHLTKEEKKKLHSTQIESKKRIEMFKDIFKEITSKKES
ncbi:MAG: glycosyltransferase [Caldisericia bacterium]|nr:glycosyltransferase [Caldisericia bacterium]